MSMARIFLLAVSLALVIVLGSAQSAAGQARLLMQPRGARVEAEKQPGGDKKKEPDWQAIYFGDGVDNRSYLAHVARISEELERFRDDPFWSDGLKQMLGTEYSYVGRYQQA